MVKQTIRLPWSMLSPSLKTERLRALTVLREMRRGTTLTRASAQYGMTREEAKRHLRSTIFKLRRRWRARKTDSIERGMIIYERGRIRSIIVTNSKDASTIGEYFNAVRDFLQSGNSSVLARFKKVRITDSKGKKHRLETNPDKIREIEDSKENPEFFEIYEVD